MSNQFRYSISLLVGLMAISFVMVSAQEDDKTAYNNIGENFSSNLSAMNDTIPSAAITEKNDSGNFSRTAPFIISGFTRPTKDANYQNQSSLNAACLSRIVEGTPHGYVTYRN